MIQFHPVSIAMLVYQRVLIDSRMKRNDLDVAYAFLHFLGASRLIQEMTWMKPLSLDADDLPAIENGQ